MEEETDLRGYISVLLRHWKIIVSITLIAGLVAGLIGFLGSPSYEAKAGLVITKARVIFEPENKPPSDEVVLALNIERETLIALVKSSSVASQVIEQLGDRLEPEERSLECIISKVQVENQGDFIEISAKDPDPEKAANIANAWAECYVNYVNSLYSDASQSPEELMAQADAAKLEYEEAEEMWKDFIRDNRIDELDRQISDIELLCQLKSLRQQFEAGASSSASTIATSLAFILIQTRAFTDTPAEFQISLDEISDINVSLNDIDALISTLEARSAITPGQSVSQLRQEILGLKAEQEQEKARQLELETSKEIAWEAYEVAAGKLLEAEIAPGAQSPIVQVTDFAVVPESPVSTNRVMNIIIALVLGFIVGILAAFVVEYFQKSQKKPRERKKSPS
jgi:succinoglycan biosynthesis transport protein ExoP